MMLLAAEGAHEPPVSLFTPVYRWFCSSMPGAAKAIGVLPDGHGHNGQLWFEGICFSLVACITLIVLAVIGTRNLRRVPSGLQSLLEAGVGGIRSMVHGMTGPGGDRYVPFIGTCFFFIFCMNLLGVFPLGRSPTMTLAITAGMGLTAFVLVQYYSFRDGGVINVLKHLAGPVWWLAPLFFAAELISELVRPFTLSLRLYGNIFGEDNVIEAFLHMAVDMTGGWIPFQMPILLLALLTAFLQAYIFSMLCTYYIASKVVHEDHADHTNEPHPHEDGGEDRHPHVEHGHGAH